MLSAPAHLVNVQKNTRTIRVLRFEMNQNIDLITSRFIKWMMGRHTFGSKFGITIG